MAPFQFGPPERLVHNLASDDLNTIMLEATMARASNNSKYKTLFQQARQAAVDFGIDVSAIDNMVHDDNAHASYVFDSTDVKNWLKYEFTTKVAWKREQRLRAGTRILEQLSENSPSPGPTQSTTVSTARQSDATAIQPTAALPTTPTLQQTSSMPPPEYSSSSASSSSSSPMEADAVVPTKPHCVFEAAKLIQGDYMTTAFIYLLSNDERVKYMWKQVFRMARGSYTRYLMVVHDSIPDINYYRETYTSARNNGDLLLAQEIQRQVFQFSCKKLLLEHWGLSGSESLDVLPKIALPMRR